MPIWPFTTRTGDFQRDASIASVCGCVAIRIEPWRSRMKGDLLLKAAASDAQPEAESCYHQAIGIARQQSAKSLELRATTSLARWYQQQGKFGAARGILAEIYGWFTEGFGTADLKEAKALLEELRARS